MKRFSKKELLKNKFIIKIRAYDFYMLNKGYKIIDLDKNIIGYITFNTFINLNTMKSKDGYGYREYWII